MPARISRASTSAAAPKTAKNKNKKRSIDAYSAATKSLPAQRIPRNRLGEVEDEPRPKRRREQDEDEDEEDAEEEKSRRKRRTKGAPGDDNVEYGSDSSGNEWTMGGLAEDDEDSDIDSDEAFGESDEERFSGFTFRGSSSSGKNKAAARSKKRSLKSKSSDAAIELDEEESDEFDDGDSEDDVGAGLGEDGVDLAAMLDDDDEEMLGSKDTTTRDMGEDDSGEEGTDDDSDDDVESESDEGDDEDDVADEEKIARMRDRLEAIDTYKSRDKQAAVAPYSAATLDDFLADTALDKDVLAGSKSKKRQLAKASAIAAPLPPRQQSRLDRQAATEKAKEQLDRWKDTVVKNRRADFLNFPLQKPEDQAATVGRSKFAPVVGEAPRNELEESIQRIMEESGLASQGLVGEGEAAGDEEGALLKSEDLSANKLPLEEVMRRRAELRRARELLFREELKAKRISKIKSKAYRKVHRKERERLAEQERQEKAEMGIEDEDEREKADRMRAESRMGTKHKESKWAKSLKVSGRAAWDDDARDGVYEQARRKEELKRRIAGRNTSDGEQSDEISEDEDHDDDNQDNNNSVMLKSLDRLQHDDNEGKGLAGMKFMLAADERRRKANEEDVQRLRKELAVQDEDEDEENEDMGEGLGRAIFGPNPTTSLSVKQKEKRLEFEAPEASDEEEDAAQDDSGILVNGSTRPKIDARGNKQKSALSRDRSITKSTSNDEVKSLKEQISWLQAPKGKDKKKVADAQVDLDLDLSNAVPSNLNEVRRKAQTVDNRTSQLPESSAGDTSGWTSVSLSKDAADSDSADEEDPNPLQENTSLKQRAFAGDDVQIAFDAEKADLELSEDEKEVSSYLPGWGAWAGEGLSKKDKKINTRTKHNPLFKSKTAGVKRADRQDAKLKNVIISEKNERKGRKYLAPVLPHEFENKEQYERSRRLPMGPEWTTKEVHQKSTRPRVVVKAGVVVNALERPIV